MRRSMKPIVFVLFGLLPVAARAGGLPERFTLGRYIPGDVWVYVHGADNPERAWIAAQWAKVFEAFKASGIDRDISSLILSSLNDEQRTDVQATLDKWTALIKAVSWGDLIDQEVAYAQRLGAMPMMFDYIVLTRGKPGTAEANLASLVAILKELSALTEAIKLSNEDRDGVTVWSLAFPGAEKEGFPLGIELFRKDDVIGFATNKTAAADVLALIAGKSEKPSFADNKRFLKALAEVPPPSDLVSFFDAKLFFSSLGRMMTAIGERAGGHRGGEGQGQGDDDAAKSIALMRTILDQADVTDYSVTTVETRGRREMRHELTKLQSEKNKSEVCSCFLDRKPFDRFDRYIPADATGFSVDASVDLERLYKFALDFIKKHIPEGEAHVAKLNEILASLGFDPEKDLFSWWSGETMSVSLPAAVVSPMGGGGDFIVMIRVKDAEIAKHKVDQFIGFVSKFAEEQGQALMVTPASVNADGFKQITHPLAAMLLRPVVGVTGDWLVIAANPPAVNKCLDVAAGKAASIVENERFKAEGLTPKGPVRSASFTDTSQFGQELGTMVSIIGMAGGMAAASIPDEGGAKQAKAVAQKALGILMKLGPVLQKIDFYSSEASVSTYDGELTLRTEKVVTYKAPAAEAQKSAEGQ